jgi:hypothetical protein
MSEKHLAYSRARYGSLTSQQTLCIPVTRDRAVSDTRYRARLGLVQRRVRGTRGHASGMVGSPGRYKEGLRIGGTANPTKPSREVSMPNFERFIADMNLSRDELETFEKYIDKLERAVKNPIEITKGGVMFTPEAALVLAVAKFAYDLYKDYKKSWLPALEEVRDLEFEQQVKSFIQDLNRLESQADGEAASLDTYTKLRKSILTAKAALRQGRSQG